MHYANTYLSKPVVPDVEIVGDGKTKVLKCMLNTFIKELVKKEVLH